MPGSLLWSRLKRSARSGLPIPMTRRAGIRALAPFPQGSSYPVRCRWSRLAPKLVDYGDLLSASEVMTMQRTVPLRAWGHACQSSMLPSSRYKKRTATASVEQRKAPATRTPRLARMTPVWGAGSNDGGATRLSSAWPANHCISRLSG